MKAIQLAGAAAILLLLSSPSAGAQTGYLYVFDDSRPGRVTDASGHGLDLDLGSAPNGDAADPVLEDDPWHPGLPGDKRLRFDGIDDFAHSARTDTTDTNFTLECRFTRGRSAALFASQVLISTRGYRPGGYELRLDSVIGAPSVSFVWFDAAGREHAVRGGAPVEVDRPYHAAVVYFHRASVTTVVLYFDGEPVGVTSVIGGKLSYAGSPGLYLGNSLAGTRPLGPKDAFKGTLDDVRFEHVDLEAPQVHERFLRPLNAVLTWGGQNRPGGTLFMGPHSPGEVNRTYALLLSLTPPTGARMPGSDTREIPIGLDFVTRLLLGGSLPGTGVYGTLIDAGWGFGTVRIPALPGLSGTRLHGAFAVLDPAAPNGVRRLSLPSETVLGR